MNGFEHNFDELLDRAVRPEVPQDMEERLSKLIDGCAAKERKLKFRRIRFAVTAAAAVALLVVGIRFATDEHQPVDTFTDPREAAIALAQTLSAMSEGCNKGLKQIEIIDSTFVHVNSIIENLKHQ